MPKINFFAKTNFRNQGKVFGIKAKDRRHHVYVIGKTGMGKTTLLLNMILSDVFSKEGLAVIDPHGDLVEKILDYVPKERVEDVIYFNPADVKHPIALNPLEKVKPERRHLVCSGLISVFKKIWPDFWGPRLEYLLRNSILTLLEFRNSTLADVNKLLSNKRFREEVIEKIKDPQLRSFWRDEFSRYSWKFQTEAIAPIQNKVGQFLTTPLIRNIICQKETKIDFRKVIDGKKILLVNLSKGKIGEDNSALLGSLIVTKLQLAAMSRIDIPERERKDFYLYVDEFQNFVSFESFAEILSEARKYKLNLTLAHQYLGQLDEKLRRAIFGNVGTMIVFAVGSEDALFLEKEFQPEFSKEDLMNQDKYHIYLKLSINGKSSKPFSALTMPPFFKTKFQGIKEKIVRTSRLMCGVKTWRK